MSESYSIKDCTNCLLYQNQTPLLDTIKESDVMFVWLSAKKADPSDIPLDKKTLSGKLIQEIIDVNPNRTFYKTNLVKCLPLDDDQKLRYPFIAEKRSCIDNLLYEIGQVKPRVIFLLWSKVSDFIWSHLEIVDMVSPGNMAYTAYQHNKIMFVPIHHPSYIQVYKRARKSEYIDNISQIIEQWVTPTQ